MEKKKCEFSERARPILIKKIYIVGTIRIRRNNFFPYICMQNSHLRTVYRQRKWPLLAPVPKIMALGRKKMALGCKIIALG